MNVSCDAVIVIFVHILIPCVLNIISSEGQDYSNWEVLPSGKEIFS
jgi:hypothetical protein